MWSVSWRTVRSKKLQIADGGHAWPGGEPLPRFIVGHTAQGIDATEMMWEFFNEHPLNN